MYLGGCIEPRGAIIAEDSLQQAGEALVQEAVYVVPVIHLSCAASAGNDTVQLFLTAHIPVCIQACFDSLAFPGDRPPAAAAADHGVQAGEAFGPGLRHRTTAVSVSKVPDLTASRPGQLSLVLSNFDGSQRHASQGFPFTLRPSLQTLAPLHRSPQSWPSGAVRAFAG